MTSPAPVWLFICTCLRMPSIWTIGHSTRSFEEFASLLHTQGVALVADVRLYPGSKRYPHFNKENLEGLLRGSGIGYRHFPDLGGRRKPGPDSPNIAWRHTAFRGYADYMETEAFALALKELEVLGKEGPTAFMCSEAVWWSCHRSLIADALKAEGWTVLHIMGEGKAKEHPYTAPARVVDGRLRYDGLF